jgi:ketosteroid isomerase-like protein
MRSIILPLAVTALALAGCDTMNKEKAAAAADPAAIEQELKTIETAWNADYNARDPSKLVTYYASDAALANPGSPIATDTVSRQLEITKFVSDPTLKLEFAADRVHVAKSGELAVTRGHYSTQVTDPATKQPKTDAGSYLTVWKKQADGSWKAVEDFVVPGAPPTP